MNRALKKAIDSNYKAAKHGIEVGISKDILLYDLNNTVKTIETMYSSGNITNHEHKNYSIKFKKLIEHIN